MTARIRKKAPVFPTNPNVSRIVEAILCVVNEATSRKKFVTQYDIVKTLFLADRSHLNKYGRPITFDNYFAFKDGPVPSLSYNLLKEEATALGKYGSPLPWKRRPAPEIGIKCFSYEKPARRPSDDVLSESDIGELRDALGTVFLLGFAKVRELTHKDPAYKDAWETGDDKKRYPMSYSLLFETPNEEKAKDLAFLSRHL